ncbi:MAG TPA: regulatory iron-sulfur-containing complex subunit RicT [Kofleriaceae bacterium]|nr:regulatory iron-sulfur-containing complex subunit RicT [Kofleriaceae bacterium]
MSEHEPGSDDDGPGDAPAGSGGTGGGAGEGEPRRRRRRRRRRGGHEAAPAPAENAAPTTSAAPTIDAPSEIDEGWDLEPAAASAVPAPAPAPAAAPTPARGPRPPRDEPRRERGGRQERRAERRNERRGERGERGERTERNERRDARPEPQRRPDAASAAPPAATTRPMPAPRLEAQRPTPPPDELDEIAAEPSVAWGSDDDAPAPEIVLAPDLPLDPPRDDEDPVSYPLLDAPAVQLGEDVASVCGVRFVPGGRLTWFDAGDADYEVGERVVVDAERGARLGAVAVAPTRRPISGRDRGLRRVIRRANDHDLRGEREGDADRARALRAAKDRAAALRLPLKVFRVELSGQGRGTRANIYYTSDERLDLRDFIRELSNELSGARIELRQLGVRDEAKAVGGIGSCGLTLCCTTWLPDFVPVSIKMAKDQGLVLSPTKVSGQCGRLKCCLVYEQAGYAELRKGLPKLGKRVIAARGEGRVVEVDVLRQRIRVSYGAGDTEVVPASEVKPLFPSGNPPPKPREPGGRPDRRGPPPPDDDADDSPEDQTDDPSALANLRPEIAGVPGLPATLDEPLPAIEPGDSSETPAIDDLDVPDDDLVDDPSRDPSRDD